MLKWCNDICFQNVIYDEDFPGKNYDSICWTIIPLNQFSIITYNKYIQIFRSITRRSDESSFKASLLYPSCNFIIETLFSECYAVIFTLYSVTCSDLDRRYWERVVYLNAFSDVKLLAYLEINR